MMSSISVTSCFPPFYGINPLPLFLEIFIILVRDLFLKMVALADMIVVRQFLFSHFLMVCMQFTMCYKYLYC